MSRNSHCCYYSRSKAWDCRRSRTRWRCRYGRCRSMFCSGSWRGVFQWMDRDQGVDEGEVPVSAHDAVEAADAFCAAGNTREVVLREAGGAGR